MRRQIVWVLAAMLFVGAMGLGTGSRTAMAQSEVLDQSNSGTFAGYTTRDRGLVGQTVTAGVSGFLTRVELQVYTSTTTASTIEVRPVGNDGLPTTTILATGTIPSGSYNQTWVSIAFSAQPYFTAGTRYAIVLTSGSISFDDTENTYAGGTILLTPYGGTLGANASYDLFFHTYVIPQAPTATNTATATVTATRTNTATSTITPTVTATSTATATNTATVTNTPTASATATNTPMNTPVPPTSTSTDTPTNTPVPPTNTTIDTPTNTAVPPTTTATDTPTNTPMNTPTPTHTATNTPTNTPVPTSTSTPLPVQATIIASADSYVQKTDPKKNFGTKKELIVDGTDDPREVYVRFSVNAAGTIRKAVLRLYVTDGSKDGPQAVSSSQ